MFSIYTVIVTRTEEGKRFGCTTSMDTIVSVFVTIAPWNRPRLFYFRDVDVNELSKVWSEMAFVNSFAL